MESENIILEDAPEPITWEEAFGKERGPDVSLLDIDQNWEKIQRFMNAAARGGPCGSGGEQRARRLAKLMSKAIEDSAGTDLEVVEGAALMMCYAAQGGDGYCTMRRILNQNGYKARS